MLAFVNKTVTSCCEFCNNVTFTCWLDKSEVMKIVENSVPNVKMREANEPRKK